MAATALQQVIGTCEMLDRGVSCLRDAKVNYQARPSDPLIPGDFVRRFGLRGGETILASVEPRGGGKAGAVVEIATINDLPPDSYAERKPFQELTAIDPRRRVQFEIPGGPLTMRVIDLLTPIGFGQRGLIVAPPRTGKTILLQQMAKGVATNHPDVYMMVLLIDERPEEVTEMRRTVHGEVVYSSNDRDIASHVRLARLMIERAKRKVECGEHIFILLDSLTRVGRAFNAHISTSGRIMSGGLDIRALLEPKAIFGAARNVEHGGSLTIIASALIDTGSRMDEVIFNEFKGTGNMEIVLSRELANKRIWPAIDLEQSGTRKEELLLDPPTLKKSHAIRRSVLGRPPDQAMETLLARLAKFPDNTAFLASLPM